jgi:hypothetical protein
MRDDTRRVGGEVRGGWGGDVFMQRCVMPMKQRNLES